METLTLTHPFLFRCHRIKSVDSNPIDGIDELLLNTKKLSTYCNRLVTQSFLYPNRYDPEKYMGDGFELFVEALIKLSPIDNRIGISKYEPITSDDTGVDGIGIGIDLKPATVQIKYRSDNSGLLGSNQDHLGNFVTSSVLRYKVDPETTTNMLIVTTAKGLYPFTSEEMFQNKVRCIGYKELRELVDNNLLFWESFRNLVQTSKKHNT